MPNPSTVVRDTEGATMTDEQLAAIRRRVEQAKQFWATGPVSLAYHDREALLAEVDRLRHLNASLAERVYAQSEILTRHAERAEVRGDPAVATNAALSGYREVPNANQ